MSKSQRDRGKRGEREWALTLCAAGFPARRGVQYQGSVGSPDVICECLPFHHEVKRTEKLSLYSAMDQARSDCGENIPLVAHRRDHHEWLVIMRAEDWLALVRESSYADGGRE